MNVTDWASDGDPAEDNWGGVVNVGVSSSISSPLWSALGLPEPREG